MANGIYLIKYTGQQGFGSATVAFLNGQVFGVDVAGAEYSGSFQEQDGKISGEISLSVPAGVPLVTGALPQNQPYTVAIPFTVPSQINEQQTVQIRVQLPTGPVNANIKKVKTIAA